MNTDQGVIDLAKSTVNFNAKVEHIVEQLQSNNGDFILIQRTHQSEAPKIWTSGDPEQTKVLFRDAHNGLEGGELQGAAAGRTHTAAREREPA